MTVAFALTKWYVDVVDDDGYAAIAYWASVRVAGVAHAVGGLLVSRDGGLADRTLTLHGAGAPTWSGDHLSWHSPSLHLSVDADRLMGAFSHRLLTTPSGDLNWHCDAPLARVRFAVGPDVIEGRGYVERLQLGVAPWALPAMRILWGRWTGPGRSVVWIAWAGAHPLRLVWLDGTLVADAVPTTDRVVLGARGTLTLHDHSVITDATVGEQLTPLQPLRAIVDRVAHQRQTRWRARGTLQEPGREDVSGWVVHEVVQWR